MMYNHCENNKRTMKSTMNREYKGHSVNSYCKDYCMVDLETTSICTNYARIVELSAIKVRGNNIVDEFSTLINPQCHIPTSASNVNNITDDMVSSAPVIEDVIWKFLDFVGNDVIVGYNISAFDMNLLYDCVESICGRYFENNYIDVMHAAKRVIDHVDNYKLITICSYFDITVEDCHRALLDCYLTKACYEKIFEQYGDSAFRKKTDYYEYDDAVDTTSIGNNGYRGIPFSEKTCKQRELIDILTKMLEDNVITSNEAANLQYWMNENTEFSTEYPFNKLFPAIEEMIKDNVFTAEELKSLKELAEQIIDPVERYCCYEPIESLMDCHVCLTGDFAYGDKEAVNALIEKAGGIADESIKKRYTRILVVGSMGSPLWKTGNYGNKIQTAIGMIDDNKCIRIMKEETFIPMVKCLIERKQ